MYTAGRNTIDIVIKENTKGDSTLKLAKILNVDLKDTIYTGDEFEPSGNDHPLLSLGIEVNPIDGPKDTLKVFKRVK